MYVLYIHNYSKVIVTVTAGLTVRFSQLNYTGLESSSSVPVTLLMEGGTSTDDITVTVIPYDLSPLSAEGKSLCTYVRM